MNVLCLDCRQHHAPGVCDPEVRARRLLVHDVAAMPELKETVAMQVSTHLFKRSCVEMRQRLRGFRKPAQRMGRLLKRLRALKGVEIREVAACSRIPSQRFALVESGRENPTPKVLAAYAVQCAVPRQRLVEIYCRLRAEAFQLISEAHELVLEPCTHYKEREALLARFAANSKDPRDVSSSSQGEGDEQV